MKGYRIKTGNGDGYYGFEDDRHDAEQLLKISQQHDPQASIEPYEYESQSEKIYRLEKERDTLKKALETVTGIKNDYFMQLQSYIKAFRLHQSALELMCADLLSAYATPINPESIDQYTKKYIQQAKEVPHE